MFYKERGGLSWSAISSFEWDKEQWYQSYIKGIRQESRELTFGNYVDKELQNNPLFLPEVERYPVMQHEMRITFDGVPLVGFADGYAPPAQAADIYLENGELKTKNIEIQRGLLADYKTGKKPWTQKRADETGQLTMYALMIYLIDKVKPGDMTFRIVWLPTQEQGDFSIGFREWPPKVKVFDTKRSMQDILLFGQRIKSTLAEMQKYVETRTN